MRFFTSSNYQMNSGLTIVKNLKMAIAAVGLVVTSSTANALIVPITVSGDTVDFSYQYDDAVESLFDIGIYQVSGDTLSFSPTNFLAHQNGLTGWDTVSSTTPLITVTAKAGYALSGLSLFEQGDYYRIQSGDNMTIASVGGQFIVDDTPNLIGAQLLATMSASSLFAELETFHTSAWAIESSVSLNSVESVSAKVENILKAGVNLNATVLDEAFIEKKLMSISANTVPVVVPVPAAFWLFGTAITGVLVARRSKVAEV